MFGRRALYAALPAVWTFSALVAVEQAADYFYLAHNPDVFFTISGMRLILFIIIAAAGSVAAGRLLKDYWASTLSEIVGITSAFLTFYLACDPRVCFSAGIDGLEPLRMGFFLVAVAGSGTALGASRKGLGLSRRALILVGFFGFAAVAYLPVIYTFAGTLILWGVHPWAVVAALVLAGYAVGANLEANVNRRAGLTVPLASLLAIILLSSGIAAGYLASLLGVTLLMVLATAGGSALGAVIVSRSIDKVSGRRSASGAYFLGLLLVLLLLLFTVPDAVNGVVPQLAGPHGRFVMGTPVYEGAYMDAPPGHALGAAVTVDFASTNSAAIQVDNFLAAGLGIHAAGCCVDGIDYSYRSDLYLFHNGSELLAATGWEVCDSNAACGGHSWKLLLFEATSPVAHPVLDQNVTLLLQWDGGDLVWSYARGGGPFAVFARFTVPPAENRNFNTGVLQGGGLNLQESGVYFFQFGIMSRYPIGHGGWRVGLHCPSLLASDWSCVGHARTLSGSQSFWKVIWRWGEDYPGVSVNSPGSRTVSFAYAPQSAQSFEALW